jgi:hypothetical protein
MLRLFIALLLCLLLTVPAAAQGAKPWDDPKKAQLWMIGGQSADYLTTWAWRDSSRELNPLLAGKDGKPHMGKVALVKLAACGSTYLFKGKTRTRLQFGLGVVGAGLAGSNITLRLIF